MYLLFMNIIFTTQLVINNHTPKYTLIRLCFDLQLLPSVVHILTTFEFERNVFEAFSPNPLLGL